MAEEEMKPHGVAPQAGCSDISHRPVDDGAQARILVSACLAGVRCVYDGSHKLCPEIAQLVESGQAIPACPEKLAGFGMPHEPSEIRGGDGAAVLRGDANVVFRSGMDVTILFLKGAGKVLKLVKEKGIRRAIFKARSPSCGCGKIYDGTFSRTLRDGDGVTAALLRKNGIEVMTDEEYLAKSSDGSHQSSDRG